jgi:hypothetical protein
VREQVSRTAHRADCPDRFGPLKHRTPGAYRDVPMPAFLEQEIEAHLRRWGSTPVGERDVLFARRGWAAGTMPTATTYRHPFRQALTAAGLLGRDQAPRYTPHTLRHFFASTALANGIPVHEVSRWLGHASIKTTVDVYGRLVPAAWERCRQTLQQAMRPTPADALDAVGPRSPGGPPRALDPRCIRSPEPGFAQVTAVLPTFRFQAEQPPNR